MSFQDTHQHKFSSRVLKNYFMISKIFEVLMLHFLNRMPMYGYKRSCLNDNFFFLVYNGGQQAGRRGYILDFRHPRDESNARLHCHVRGCTQEHTAKETAPRRDHELACLLEHCVPRINHFILVTMLKHNNSMFSYSSFS